MNTLSLDLLTRLSRERGENPHARPGAADHQLPVPDGLQAPLGHDAVGVDARHGEQIRRSLPRVGCIYAQQDTWWWLVPGQAQIGLDWTPVGEYAIGARVCPDDGSGRLPHLLHLPESSVPYTHPLLLYIAACRAVGIEPAWTKP